MNNFAERLYHLRIESDGYQKELAHHLHVSVGTVSNYENGIHCPDLNTLCKIAQYCGVTTDYLIGLTDCPYPADTLNQVIADGYTVGQFLALLEQLPDDAKAHLVWILRLFGR